MLHALQNRRRKVGRATGIISFQRVGHSLRRKKHRRREPDGTGREIKPARERGKGTHLRVIDAAKTIGLHHPVPNAPEENHQNNPL